MPNALLIAPKQPVTFWSFNESLKMIKRKCNFPPLGLLTIAGMLPESYDLRVHDLNIGQVDDTEFEWADIVITSSMIIHWASLEEVIARSNRADVPILCGGPLPTQYHDEIEGDAVFYLGEAENGFLDIVERLVEMKGTAARENVDRRKGFRALSETPLPRWDLIDLDEYTDMLVQITRGCPESCTFCNIPALYGKTTRVKDGSQTVRELEALEAAGWRGSVMAVDDNFIGNRDNIVRVLQEDIAPWQEERNYPFQLYTQASVRMADDPELLEAMLDAGFNHVFCGIETPVKASLKFMGAQKNLQGDSTLLEKVKTLQRYGFEISAGFIVGLDTDPDDVAEIMINFIQEAAIPVAMVGILGVLRDTPDYKRFGRAGRLVEGAKYSGDSGLFRKELSFVPVIEPEELFRRHREIVTRIHSAEYYFPRVRKLISRLGRYSKSSQPVRLPEIQALFRSFWKQGVLASYRWEYWKTLLTVLITDPRRLPMTARLAIQGHHMVTVTQQALEVAKIQNFYDESLGLLEQIGRGAKSVLHPRLPRFSCDILEAIKGRLSLTRSVGSLRRNAEILHQTASRRIGLLGREYRGQARHSLNKFRGDLDVMIQRYSGADVVTDQGAYERS